jgi:hypothetical protein
MVVEKNNERINEDPLSCLYQLDEDRHTPAYEVLTALTNIFDNVEKIGILDNTLKDLINTDEVAGIRILNQLEKIIQGIKREHVQRADREWRLKFRSLFDLIR